MNGKLGKVAIVTGASTGIGRAVAEALAGAGYQVFGTSRRPNGEGPRGVTMLACDVTDDASVQALVAEVIRRAGHIDLLVNNAGMGLVGAAEESSIAQVRSLFEVNVFGVMRATNAVLPSMRQRRQGRIINISSVLGLIPTPFGAHYGATKHAIEGYSESLDHEVREYGIRVSLIEPAYTRSTFEQNALEPDAPISTYDAARAGARALISDMMATVADDPAVVAQAVLVAARAAEPRRRYAAGKMARQTALLRRFVPAGAFDKSLRKQMRLPA